MGELQIVGVVFLVIICAILFSLFNMILKYIPLWFNTRTTGAKVSWLDLVIMSFRKINIPEILNNLVRVHKLNLNIDIHDLQNHALKGGKVSVVVAAMISAHKSKINISFAEICRIDLSGINPYLCLQNNINPQFFVCPHANDDKQYITAVAKDGIRLGARVKISAKVDPFNVIGSANEDTMIARVGECIVSFVGRAKTHRDILDDTSLLVEYILSNNVDKDTFFELVSVDVDNIEILDNIGAHLESMQSEADEKVANAKSEGKKAEALAYRQEMRAKIRLKQAELLLSKTALPHAVSSAYKEGNMGNKFIPVESATLKS